MKMKLLCLRILIRIRIRDGNGNDNNIDIIVYNNNNCHVIMKVDVFIIIRDDDDYPDDYYVGASSGIGIRIISNSGGRPDNFGGSVENVVISMMTIMKLLLIR